MGSGRAYDLENRMIHLGDATDFWKETRYVIEFYRNDTYAGLSEGNNNDNATALNNGTLGRGPCRIYNMHPCHGYGCIYTPGIHFVNASHRTLARDEPD